jgi:V/A-type H+-transporting ATPase subunit F
MRMVCISKNNDIVVGLRLAGIQTFLIRDNDEIKKKIKDLSQDSDVGIINITEDIYEIAKEELDYIRDNQDLPLVVKIPNA